jgi:hypothetical protein
MGQSSIYEAVVIMSQRVTIATFSQPIEAHIYRARLQAEGIPCMLADEHTIGMNWFYSNAIGGVKLQVPEEYTDKAQAIVADAYDAEVDWAAVDPCWADDVIDDPQDAEAVLCPRCGSAEVQYEKFSRPMVFLSILLLGIPVPFLSRQWTCASCELRWKVALFRQS